MKKLTPKIKILIIILAIIIIAGIAIIATIGFNFELKYQETKKIELNLQKEFEISDVREITNEIFPNQEITLQKVELYEDTVCIITKEITEEQKNNLIQKINEKFETEIVSEDTQILSIPHTKLRDIFKPYIMPFVIATLAILAYMAIRYNKLGIVKVLVKTFGILAISELTLLSVMAITRIPMGRLTLPLIILVYVFTLFGITNKFEKNLLDSNKENKVEKESNQ